MDNYTPNPFKTQPIYDPTRPFATPSQGLCCVMKVSLYRADFVGSYENPSKKEFLF